jgi:ribosomal subunit interface protein
MIKKLEIGGVHTTVDEDLRKYVNKKIGRLDKYLPRHMRDSTHVEVKLKEGNSKDKNQYTCEIIAYLPQEVLNLEECTVSMYAAVDIAEEKLKHQFKKYKDLHANPKLHRRMAARFKRKFF